MSDESEPDWVDNYPDDAPQSPADERDEPYYIDTDCAECGTELVLADHLSDAQRRASQVFLDPDRITDKPVWYDEWACPICLDGIYLDVPPEVHPSEKEMRGK